MGRKFKNGIGAISPNSAPTLQQIVNPIDQENNLQNPKSNPISVTTQSTQQDAEINNNHGNDN